MPSEGGLRLTQERIEAYVAQIRAVLPDLPIESVRVEPAGQRSDVLVINGSVVFRFPCTVGGVDGLPKEIAILRAIRGRVPLPTPDPVYENLATRRVGAAFVGYLRLPGEPLWPDTLRGLDCSMRDALAGQLAHFLKALHGIPANVIQVDLPVEDRREAWANVYLRIRTNLFSFMRPESQIDVARHFARYLDDPGSFAFVPAVRHGDFGPSNILFDRASGTIVGVIDFGSAGLGDPALDLAGVLGPAGYGAAFLSGFAPFYPGLNALLPRAWFYIGTFALQEALWGIEHHDRQAFETGIAAYR